MPDEKSVTIFDYAKHRNLDGERPMLSIFSAQGKPAKRLLPLLPIPALEKCMEAESVSPVAIRYRTADLVTVSDSSTLDRMASICCLILAFSASSAAMRSP